MPESLALLFVPLLVSCLVFILAEFLQGCIQVLRGRRSTSSGRGISTALTLATATPPGFESAYAVKDGAVHYMRWMKSSPADVEDFFETPRRSLASVSWIPRSVARSQGGWIQFAALVASAAAQAHANARAEDQADSELARSYNMADTSLQRRVADAKAAGVHPLYALGANLPQFNPIQVFQDTSGYQNAANIAASIPPAKAKPEQKGEVYPVSKPGWIEVPTGLDLGEGVTGPGLPAYVSPEEARPILENDLIQNQILESQARRKAIEMGANAERRVLDTDPTKQGAWEYQAAQVPTSDAHTWATAGPGMPMWSLYNFGDGLQVYLPSSSASESLESVSESTLLLSAVVEFNRRRFGDAWVEKFKQSNPALFGSGRPAAKPSDVPVF